MGDEEGVFSAILIVHIEATNGEEGGLDESPSGQTLYPASSHPGGWRSSPFTSNHQRMPAHRRDQGGRPASLVSPLASLLPVEQARTQSPNRVL